MPRRHAAIEFEDNFSGELDGHRLNRLVMN